MAVVSLAELLEAGVHFGHQARRWNPKMFPYIYAERNGIHIIDLVQTAQLLTQACNFTKAAAEEGKTFLICRNKKTGSWNYCSGSGEMWSILCKPTMARWDSN